MVSSRRIKRLASIEVFILSGALSHMRAHAHTHSLLWSAVRHSSAVGELEQQMGWEGSGGHESSLLSSCQGGRMETRACQEPLKKLIRSTCNAAAQESSSYFILFFIKSLTVHSLLLDYCAPHGPFQPYVFLLLIKIFFLKHFFVCGSSAWLFKSSGAFNVPHISEIGVRDEVTLFHM